MRLTILALALAIACCGCEPQPTHPTEPVQSDQQLPLTLGGFVLGGAENERVQGVCYLGTGREVLECDMYNGLTKWTLTELTIVVTWFPYNDDDKRYYRTPVVVEPLTTSRITARLGLVLPREKSKWAWQTVGARGRPAK
jgi:hypothetical protein